MRKYNKILEAIKRGVDLALDDYDDIESSSKKISTFKDKNSTKEFLDLLEYFVDLGLPSGTLWGKYNIGADCDEYPESWYGDYFSWGDINTDKRTYSEAEYKFTGKMTKYNKEDGLVNLQPEDDQATQLIHIHNYNIHIPTKEQCEELLKYCVIVPEFNYMDMELNGYKVRSTINNNSIFIPCAGYYFSDTNSQENEHCAIQSSTRYSDPYRYYGLMLKSGGSTMNSSYYRTAGLPIRPVCSL